MRYTVKRATDADFPVMQEIFRYARAYMKENGNPTQWKDDRPPITATRRDIERGTAYMICDGDTPAGTFAFIVGEDPTYRVIDGRWLRDAPYGTIHRIAAAAGAHGVFDACMDFCRQFRVDIRIDTHKDNRTMRHLVEKYGFSYCGIIKVDDGTDRMAFQWVYEENKNR